MPEGSQSTTSYVYILGKLAVGQRKGETVGREKRKSKRGGSFQLAQRKAVDGKLGTLPASFWLGNASAVT